MTIDGIPGSQVEGISPLYHVGNLDGPDSMSAVVQILTKLGPRELIEALGAVEAMHGKAVDLDLVDMQGVVSDEPDCRVPWPSAGKRAAVLAPWMDMDPAGAASAATRCRICWPWHPTPTVWDCCPTLGL